MNEYTFDPNAIRVKDARDYRKLTGATVWASMEAVAARGASDITEDEVLGLAFLVRKQNESEAFTIDDMDDWTIGQCVELLNALSDAMSRPQTGSPTSS